MIHAALNVINHSICIWLKIAQARLYRYDITRLRNEEDTGSRKSKSGWLISSRSAENVGKIDHFVHEFFIFNLKSKD